MSTRRCCVMMAHFKPDTRANKVAWGIFAASGVMGLIMTPLGVILLNKNASSYSDCLEENHLTVSTDYHGKCDSFAYDVLDWYRVFVWGIFFLVIACGCLCYFWCCAVPPGYSGHISYSVTGTNVMMASMPVHGIETQPLFPGMQYSSSMQYSGSGTQYGGAMMPPAYQFAQLYPSHMPPLGAPQHPVPMYTATIVPGVTSMSDHNRVPTFSQPVMPASNRMMSSSPAIGIMVDGTPVFTTASSAINSSNQYPHQQQQVLLQPIPEEQQGEGSFRTEESNQFVPHIENVGAVESVENVVRQQAGCGNSLLMNSSALTNTFGKEGPAVPPDVRNAYLYEEQPHEEVDEVASARPLLPHSRPDLVSSSSSSHHVHHQAHNQQP
ncbi:hypothetical protein CEUSTIGMA_g2610.t1 [Chlamydomonas eustigma]|uniref:Uncharacterized protein n=1 Tax=Chlamydomonas eustigma TaxID=1157962 RepID=A0A250WWM5_9CHLO|nr:hypothetical protein CEUSTIGMA_g2610.t1 [Chlamydomonas eustigma]|eukprot:GAX75166.1 hypothetical protein CEUSTIGMA_g2610.t1 [Chlamydomonas eustigma]